MPGDVLRDDGEFKDNPPTAHKAWIAMCIDVREHEIVGLRADAPNPADPERCAWSPFEVWFWMLCEAARKDRQRVIQGRKIVLLRGQLAVSLRYLAREANWTVKSVRRFLDRLRKHDMITLAVGTGEQMSLDFAARELSDVCPKRGTGITVATICNYEKYQHAPPRKGTGRAQHGHRSGTGGAQDSTQIQGDTDTGRSPTKGYIREDARIARGSQIDHDPSGTDDASGNRLPFTNEALASCEAMGFTRETLVKRYYQRTKGKHIGDPSAYLIAMAIDMAAKARGVRKDALKASLSKNPEERAAAYGQATGAPPEPSPAMRRVVERRCKLAKRDPVEMFADWHTTIKGTRVLHVDQHVDRFCAEWVRKPSEEAA